MTLASRVIERYPLQVEAGELRRALADIEMQAQTYEDIIKKKEALKWTLNFLS